MKILVAIKQVPDTETRIKVDASGRTLDAADVKWIISPYDEYALEEALRIREARGGEILAVSAGDDRARDVLRSALALGVDRALLVRTPEGADALSVAKVLANVARSEAPDLLLFGHKAYGTDHSAVGPMVAELLGLGQANLVTSLEIGEGTFRAEREGDGGTEIVEGRLPAVITAQRGLNEPRYANLKGIMASKKKPIEEVEGALVSPMTAVASLGLPPARPEGRKLEGDAAQQAHTLIQLLHEEAKVI
jgi:electron transfer flavoprotein beta subunit